MLEFTYHGNARISHTLYLKSKGWNDKPTSMQGIDFYQQHLDRVSRSFAFCIQKLNDPFRRHVSLAYLLCRVLDTIEDSAWTTTATQLQQYAAFEQFLKALPTPESVQAWAKNFPASIPDSERALANDALLLFQDLHGLPSTVQAAMRDTVLRMGDGMKHYSETQAHSAPNRAALKLANLKEVNQYCYFVAGIVGELLSRLFIAYRDDFQAPPDFMKNAFHFGLFLQKVNLLKDQRGDEKEGRFLVPNREHVLESLRKNAMGSLHYLTSLPTDEAGYRTFCAWSLFLGLASMPTIQENYEAQNGVKISRETTMALLAEIEKMVQDNEAILHYGEECLGLIPNASTLASETSGSEMPTQGDSTWFSKIAGNALNRQELTELEIL